MFLFFLSSQINHILVIQVGHTVHHLAVRCLDESQLINLGIDTKRGNQTDIWTFRALDRTQTTIVSIVHVAHLKTGTLTRQTTGTQGGETTLVSHLGQRVGLVHELRQRVGTKERVDDARDGLGINQVSGREHLIVAHVHTLTDSTAHTCQTDGELVAQLLAYRTYTTV